MDPPLATRISVYFTKIFPALLASWQLPQKNYLWIPHLHQVWSPQNGSQWPLMTPLSSAKIPIPPLGARKFVQPKDFWFVDEMASILSAYAAIQPCQFGVWYCCDPGRCLELKIPIYFHFLISIWFFYGQIFVCPKLPKLRIPES